MPGHQGQRARLAEVRHRLGHDPYQLRTPTRSPTLSSNPTFSLPSSRTITALTPSIHHTLPHPDPYPQAALRPVPGKGTKTARERMVQLNELFQDGFVTQEEFDAKRRDILNSL